MFCACDAEHFGIAPNTHTCPVCLGLPGALPVPNKKAVEYTVMVGRGMNCRINEYSKWDRKHYFYPDLPKSYQISQYDLPFCEDGLIKLVDGDVRVERAHLEEDTGKLKHTEVNEKKVSLVDYNRSSVPLLEIVSHADVKDAKHAMAYAKKIAQIVRYLGVSDADMEKGSMRLEANISLRKPGEEGFPPYKVEVKNINSFRFLGQAIDFEIERQGKILDTGEIPDQETRGWNERKNQTVSQRSKETAKDYRYFPCPDLPPVVLSQEMIADILKDMPMLPDEVEAKLMDEYSVREDYVETLLASPEMAHFALACLGKAEEYDLETKVIVNHLVNKKVDPSAQSENELLTELQKANQKPSASDDDMKTWISEALKADPDVAEKLKAGQMNVMGAVIGKVMQLSKGQADPKQIPKLLRELL